jgi:RsiW-degrading membrane proteinase PrsW (M82 family)
MLKHIFTYLFWTILSLTIGFGYMRLLLGPNDISEEGISYLLHLFFVIGMIKVGLWVGGAIAICFVSLDIFYLRKKLKNNPKRTVIRLAALLIITVLVAIVHYLLEKVIDVI